MTTSERNSYTFFISDSRARARSFYYSLLFGSICGFFSIAVGDSDLGIAAITIIGTSIAFWVYFLVYLHTKHPASVVRAETITRRGSWRYLAYAAIPFAFVTAISKARSLGQRAALAVAHQVNVQASEALKSYSANKVPVNVPIERLTARADSARAVYSGTLPPMSVVEAIVKLKAAAVASRIPVSPEFSDDSVVFGPETRVGATVGYDTFIARFTCVGSVPYSTATGLVLEGNPTVLVYQSKLEGVTQTIDRITWIETLFTKCLIRYSGRSILLSGVRFEDCKLDASMASLPGLSSLIRSHNDGSKISFASDL